jgi:hypothetical protein
MSLELLKCNSLNTALNIIYSVMQDTAPRREAPVRLLDIHQRSFPGDIRDLPDNDNEIEDIYFPEGSQK